MICFWKIFSDCVSMLYIYEIKLGSSRFFTKWTCSSLCDKFDLKSHNMALTFCLISVLKRFFVVCFF